MPARRKPPKPAPPRKNKPTTTKPAGIFDVPTITQNIRVRKSQHGTVTDFDPSNKVIRADLLSDDYQFPFQSVCRKYLFENGIPEEYWWDEECQSHAGCARHTLTQTLTRDTWLQMADQEKQNPGGHAVSGYEFFDEKDEDEN